MDERGFIEALRKLPLHPGARGLEDDCAVLEIGQETLILTHDSMAERTHWLPDADPYDIAWKLVATNLSDLASKGADPIGLLLSHTLGKEDERFVEGLHAILSQYDVPLLGGDTIKADGPRTLGLTAIGRATHTPVPARSGAQIGDYVYVTGALGRAMLAFVGDPAHLDAYNRPVPRLSEGQALAPHVTAMMDISDGLLLDAFRMAQASEVTLSIDSSKVPVAAPERHADCLCWGDDYELLFTLPPDVVPPVLCTRIGKAEPQGFAPMMLDGEPIVNSEGLGYQH
ncbi:MAG: thiamine-phosphate kinase [Altererythrobacter sp.]|nr:thiamine-phosphate kinase [Altererythrobacter sp.]MBO6609789.1 thiamine-phosphate kinase [Altererythrobacter sp.]MBO6641009.1 thiamine-phosphate kinase [Altererythrobacter sp.]MBO6708293.1 thiamine-phosphate kinase [Altererythrobacter sp.]